MKKNYNPQKLSKRQRHMKKWIPDYHYCEGIYGKECPFYKVIWWHFPKEDIDAIELDDFYSDKDKKSIKKLLTRKYPHKINECQFANRCKDNCSTCNLQISYCDFLKYTEYGQFPLGDMCKICGVHTLDRKKYRRNIHGHYFKAKGWKAQRKNQEKFNKSLKVRMKWYPELFKRTSYDDLKEDWSDLIND